MLGFSGSAPSAGSFWILSSKCHSGVSQRRGVAQCLESDLPIRPLRQDRTGMLLQEFASPLRDDQWWLLQLHNNWHASQRYQAIHFHIERMGSDR